jgi:hypothetical protein
MFLLSRLGNGQHSAVGDTWQFTKISVNPSRLAKFPELKSPFLPVGTIRDDAIERYSSNHRCVLTGSLDPRWRAKLNGTGRVGYCTD